MTEALNRPIQAAPASTSAESEASSLRRLSAEHARWESRTRAPARDAVRSLGFNADIVHQGEVGRPLEEAERHGFWEFKVTSLGKVITVRRPEETTRVGGGSTGR